MFPCILDFFSYILNSVQKHLNYLLGVLNSPLINDKNINFHIISMRKLIPRAIIIEFNVKSA